MRKYSGIVLLLLSLFVCEAGIRLAWRYFLIPQNAEFSSEGLADTVKEDSEIGWISNPGKHPYIVKDFRTGLSREVVVGIGRLGDRAGNLDKIPHNSFIILGCSIANGFMINDEQTLTPLLSNLLPDKKIFNFGTPGYGLYQSLLLLKKLIMEQKISSPNVIVLYAEDHDRRDVLTPDWLPYRTLYGAPSRHLVPYCEMTNGVEKCHPPREKPFLLALGKYLYISKLFYMLSGPFFDQDRISSENEVSVSLLKQLKQTVESVGGSVTTVFVLSSEEHYKRRSEELSKNQIHFFDCRDKRYHLPEYKQADGLHPNFEYNKILADCVSKAFQAQLPSNGNVKADA